MAKTDSKPNFPTNSEEIEELDPGIYDAGNVGDLLKKERDVLEREDLIADESETDIAFLEEDRYRLGEIVERLSKEAPEDRNTDEGYDDIVIWGKQAREEDSYSEVS